jgi:hypothetical protein
MDKMGSKNAPVGDWFSVSRRDLAAKNAGIVKEIVEL